MEVKQKRWPILAVLYPSLWHVCKYVHVFSNSECIITVSSNINCATTKGYIDPVDPSVIY